MPSYPVRIIDGEDGLVLVTFPDVPEAVACSIGDEAALDRASELLDLVLAGYRAQRRPMPEPSHIRGAPQVEAGRYRIPVRSQRIAESSTPLVSLASRAVTPLTRQATPT